MKHQTIHQILKHQAEQNPEATAILAPDRPPLTYRALYQQVERTVGWLNDLDIGLNERVAIVLPNGPDMAVAFLAVAAGATSAPLNPAYRAAEFDFYLSDLGAKALLIQADMEDSPAREVAQARGVPIIELAPEAGTAGSFSFGGGNATATPGPEGKKFAQQDDVALVLHTSGTTSRPKIVPLTQANLCASAYNIKKTLSLTPDDRCLNVMPLFHIHGLMAAVLSSMLAGASVVCMPGFHVDQFFEGSTRFKPTWYTAVPTIHQAILNRVEAKPELAARAALRFIRSSSSALPPQVMAGLERAFEAPVIEAYGMTEASHQMASNPLPPKTRKPGTVGLAAGPEVAIMDETGTLLPAGQPGEIVIKGANVTLGYENNPAANGSAFTDGWFRTGDRGVIDDEGYLSIIGRIKEIVNRGGEKIAPREVDEVFLDHPAVRQATAFALPHPTLGEDLAVAVVLQENSSITEPELRQFAFSRLADYKVPSRVVIVEAIPKGPTGKLQRIGLAQKLAAQLEVAYVPPQTELEVALVELWSEALGLEQVGLCDNFFALGGDSVTAVRVVNKMMALTGQSYHVASLFQSPTIEQWVSHLQVGAAATASLLVPIQDQGSKRSFFCVAGHNDNPFIFKELAQHLGGEQPFYAFRFPQGIGENEAALEAMIETIAASYIREMQQLQPEGPYLLGGYCFGGKVAFEMAQQLHRQGQRVDLLVICQSFLPGSTRLSGFKAKIRYHLNNLVHLPAPEKHVYLGKMVKNRILKTTRKYQPDWGRSILQAMQEANYVPQRYPGRFTLFRASEQPAGVDYDPYMGWRNLAGEGVELVEIPGSSQTAYKEPHVQVFAERLKACLDQVPG